MKSVKRFSCYVVTKGNWSSLFTNIDSANDLPTIISKYSKSNANTKVHLNLVLFNK